MARTATVRIILVTNDDNKIEKLLTVNPPHAGRNGKFLWQIENQTGETVEIDLRDFTPPDFVKIITHLPISIDDGDTGAIIGKVQKSEKNPVTVTYAVYIDGVRNDPDLIIDGDGDHIPKGKKRGAKKR